MSKQLPCEGKTKSLGLFNVEQRSMRGHMAEVYKIVKAVGKTKSGWEWLFTKFHSTEETQWNYYKYKTDQRKYLPKHSE